MTTNSVTWHGGAGVEIVTDDSRLMIDPYSLPATIQTPNYICVTHDDHDHFDEQTIARFASEPEFRQLLVPPSCVDVNRLDSPVLGLHEGLSFVPDGKLTVIYPGLTREPGDSYDGPTSAQLGDFDVLTIDSSERPERYRVDAAVDPLWPEQRGLYVGHTRYPNVGYHVTSRSTGLSFYHPGDLHEQFNAHYDLPPIDVLFMPLPKFVGQETSLIELLRPRYIVPIHYRVFTENFPVPYDVPEGIEVSSKDWEEFRRNHVILMGSHWYPSPDDPPAYLESLRPGWEELGTKLIVLEAGTPFDLSQLA
jgi:L-ascorbate metabolism protein UlaG (beta-lactamase superfamily)